jgi:polyhydroxyalkanoate synthesis regulator phasin
MKTRMMVILGVGGLLVVALFAAGMLFGNSLAQDANGTENGVENSPVEKNVIVKEIEIEGGSGAGLGFPLEAALRELAADGELAPDDVDAIMSDLSDLTDAVNYQSSSSADGSEREVSIDITIDSSNADALREAAEAALDKAVNDGRLTAEQAAAVLAEVDAAPDLLAVPPEGQVHIETFGEPAAENFTAPLQSLLDDAVAAGTVSAEEADVFLSVLERLLSE